MKIFMKILVAIFTVSVMFSLVPFESTCSKLENDVFRLHILANSDSEADQKLKLMVRDEIIKNISPLYINADSKDEVIRITENNLEYIEKMASELVLSCGYDYYVKAEISNEFFDTRYYEDFTMPAGFYDSLVIYIGEAEGKNWWCVMYPSLCVGAASEKNMKEDLSEDEYDVITSDDLVFKFKIVEYFEKLCAVFD